MFGNDLDEDRLQKVYKASALVRDLEQFSDGDLTLVGDRGVTLSGGQKARISLARTMYAQSDIYLLDDPLSAVDAVVGSHIYKHAIQGKYKSSLLSTVIRNVGIVILF